MVQGHVTLKDRNGKATLTLKRHFLRASGWLTKEGEEKKLIAEYIKEFDTVVLRPATSNTDSETILFGHYGNIDLTKVSKTTARKSKSYQNVIVPRKHLPYEIGEHEDIKELYKRYDELLERLKDIKKIREKHHMTFYHLNVLRDQIAKKVDEKLAKIERQKTKNSQSTR